MESPPRKLYAQFVLALAGILLVPAIWSFFSAVHSAWTTGQVVVIALVKHHDSELVPWRNGWARFAAPPLLVASVVLWSLARGRQLIWWLSVAAAGLGLFLLLYSMWFTSVRNALTAVSIVIFIAVAAFLGHRYGRWYAYAFVLFLIFVWAWRFLSHA